MLKTFATLHKRHSKTWLHKRYSQVSEITESNQNEKDKTIAFNATIINSNVNHVENKNQIKLDKKALEDKFEDWQKPFGKMKILHAMNKLRIPFIRDGLLAGEKRGTGSISKQPKPLKGFRILDVGRGGGVLSEPLARMGATVTGTGMSAAFVMLATHGAIKDPTLMKDIIFINTSIETLAQKDSEKYDAVIATEILEHEEDKPLFLKRCLQVLKPGGSIFITTLNRTPDAWIGGLALPDTLLDNMEKCSMADASQSITPAEISTLLKDNGCEPMTEKGMFYLFVNNTWYWTSRKSTSYAMQAIKQRK